MEVKKCMVSNTPVKAKRSVIFMEKLTYSIQETAELLGISRSLAYELAKKDEIPVRHLGGRLVVPVKALEHFIATGQMD